jgi:hypothetical protein
MRTLRACLSRQSDASRRLRARSDVSANILTGTLPPGLGALTALTLLCVPCPGHTRAAC